MSNFSKFKAGDKVETIYKGKGKVRNVYKNIKGFQVVISFYSGVESTYSEEQVKFDTSDMKENIQLEIGETCPVCSTDWQITKFGNKVWKDCLTCNKTAEELVSSSNNEDFGTSDLDDAQNLWVDSLKFF